MTKNHKPWTITAKSSSEIEILLYEMIGQDFWTGEGTTAKSFAEDLKAAGDGIRKIHLRVNSPGGSVFDGLAIYNTLLGHGAKVTASVDGLAASIASVIVMAASEISMADNGMMMIHNPSTVVGGDSVAMRKMAETLDKVKTSMITAYRRHSKMSVEEIGALCDAETWMTAQETVDNGFAELVNTPEGDDASNDVAANFAPILAKFRKVPQQIAARFSGSTSHTKRVDGENLTSNAFIYVGDEEKTDTWHLPWHFAEEEKTKSHLRDALARFDQTEIPASEKPAARAKLVRLCKEHGITVADKDKKAAKALARLAAAAEICMCDCFACKGDACPDCSNSACDDENCQDCPAQASAKAKARLAKLKKRRGPEAAAVCACTCLPCSKENNCEDCTNAGCADANCEDCPAQATAAARARAAASKCDCTCLPCSKENNCQDCVNADCDDEACNNGACPMQAKAKKAREARWLGRVGGELGRAVALSNAGTADLTQRLSAAQALHADVRARVGSAAKLLSALRAERIAEVSGVAKWTERVGADLEESGRLLASATAEIGRQATLTADCAPIVLEIAAAEKTLGEIRGERAAENTALAHWTARVGADLETSGKLLAGIADEMAAIARAAEECLAQSDAEVSNTRTALLQMRESRSAETLASAKWMERLAGELRLDVDPAEELLALARNAGERAVQASTELAQTQGSLEAERKSRLEDATAQQRWIERKHSELDQAAKLCAAALEDLPRRAQAAVQVAQIAADRLANARTALLPLGLIQLLEAEHTTRSEEAAVLAKWTEGKTEEFNAAVKLLTAAMEDLPRRAHSASAHATQIQAELASAQTLADSGRKAREEAAAAHTLGSEHVTASLRETRARHNAVADELRRRAGAAEQNALATTEPGLVDASVAQAAKEERAGRLTRATGNLGEAAKLHTAAADELVRRSRLADSAQPEPEEGIGAHLEAAGKLLAEFKQTLVAKATGAVSAELAKAVKLQAALAEDFRRRCRMADSSAELGGELGAHLEAAESALTALKDVLTSAPTIDPETTANLKKAAELYGSAVDEIARRARLAAL